MSRFVLANNLLKSCKKLIDYWKRTGPLHFQTEKLASYFSMIEAGINEIDPSQVVREEKSESGMVWRGGDDFTWPVGK